MKWSLTRKSGLGILLNGKTTKEGYRIRDGHLYVHPSSISFKWEAYNVEIYLSPWEFSYNVYPADQTMEQMWRCGWITISYIWW
jgi:hypothetical protein